MASARAHLQKNLGFTLIELLVVIGILALVTGGAIAAYRNFNDRQFVITSAKQFISVLRIAQKRASVGDKPATCAGTTSLDGYRVMVSGNNFTLYAVCSGALRLAGSYTLQSGVTFSGTPYAQFIDLGRGVIFAIPPNPSPTERIFTIQSALYSYTITVTNTGEIKETGPTPIP